MATDGLRFILVFDADNSYFLDAASENRLDEAINMTFIRAAEAAVKAVNTGRIGTPTVDVTKIRDGNGNMIGTLKMCYGRVDPSPDES